jgi:hypothetical protein
MLNSHNLRDARRREGKILLGNTWAEEDQQEQNRFRAKKSAVWIGIVLGGLLFWWFIISLMAGCSIAAEIPQDKAVLAIIGEAEGEGYKGMLAVAGAIRNRGSLKGVYGLNAPRVVKHRYSLATYKLAQQAWQESAFSDITGGATHWEGTKFKTPYWANGMIKTVVIGNQAFYKERG